MALLRKYLWVEAARLAAKEGRQSEIYREEDGGWSVDAYLVDEAKVARFKLSALAGLQKLHKLQVR